MREWLAQFFGGSPSTILTTDEVVLVLVGGTAGLIFIISGLVASASVLLRRSRNARERRRLERFADWQGPLQRVLYDEAAREELWTRVPDDASLDFMAFLLEYVRRLDGRERDEICSLAEPYLPRIFRYLQHPAEGRRMRAVQTIGELGLARYSGAVLAALDDPSPMVAMVAASTLAQGETPEHAGAVLSHLRRFSHWRQDFLVSMLASMGAGAAEALRATLSDASASSRVRAVAADALALVSDPLAADPALLALTTSDDVELQAAAVRLLASVGRAEHLDPVRTALQSESIPLRLAAIRALGRFGLPEDLAPLEAAARDDASPWIAIASARALKEGGGIGALERLAGSDHPRAALGLQVMTEARSW